MSLLLDAMKKSGNSASKSTELSLEPSSPTPSSTSQTANRAAGETLFAAKRKPAKGPRWKLGLVPTTFLICSIIGAAYGYYVWLEIQPPKRQVIATVQAPPPAAPAQAIPAPLSPLVPPVKPEEAPTPKPDAAIAQGETVAPPAASSGGEAGKPKAVRPRSRTSNLAIQRTLETDGVTPLLIEAWQAYQRGDYATAAKGYHQVLTKDPNNHDALLGLAATAQQQGMDDMAQRYYRQLLVLDPRDPAAHAALSAYAVSDAADNESRLKQLLIEQPRSAPLHFALGNLYADRSDWASAQEYYFNALSIEPGNAQYAYNLAVSLDHLGQVKLASQHYQQALQLDTAGRAFDHAQAEQRLNELAHPQ